MQCPEQGVQMQEQRGFHVLLEKRKEQKKQEMERKHHKQYLNTFNIEVNCRR